MILLICYLNRFLAVQTNCGCGAGSARLPTAPAPNFPSSFPPAPPARSSSVAAAAANLVPVDVNSSVLLAAALSVPLSLLVLACLACRRCRRRGRGTMLPPSSGTAKYKELGPTHVL